MASRSWSVAAGLLLLARALLIALYWGVYTTPRWLVEIPGLGAIPLVPILLVIFPAIAGAGIVWGAAWARVLGIGLAATFLALAGFALVAAQARTLEAGPLIDAGVEGALSLFIVFALSRRWVPRSATGPSAAPRPG